MENIATAEQLEQLAAYMASQINVPTIGIGGGYAPIGTIISVMGTTAPQDYLACDGTVYNIADYPQLADYFESQFGESNHFGGDGATTFAVPDLQGEFLRGTGTNSHTNQGSGANVGVHQDGTTAPILQGSPSDSKKIVINLEPAYSDWGETYTNADYVKLGNRKYVEATGASGSASEDAQLNYSVRPTNTSVLYCIKAVVAGEVYSTEERVVGTWIDGKPIYQKTIADVALSSSIVLVTTISNLDTLINAKGQFSYRGGSEKLDYIYNTYYIDNSWGSVVYREGNDIKLAVKGGISSYKATVTIQYTKTTDG